MKQTLHQSMIACMILLLGLNFSVHTLNAQVVLAEDFESSIEPKPPVGWSIEKKSGIWKSLFADPGFGNQYEGSYCMYFDYSSGNAPLDGWLISPSFNFSAGKKYSISFYYKNQSTLPNKLDVTIGKGNKSINQTKIIWEKNVTSAIYEKAQINYTATENAAFNLGFHITTKNLTTYLYLDVVEIKEVVTFPPQGLKVFNENTSFVDASWKKEDSVVYEYSVNERPVPPQNFERTALNYTRLTPLEAKKKYYLFVRSVSKAGKSDWTMERFTTAYDINTIDVLNCDQKFNNNSFIAGDGLYLNKYCADEYYSREFFHRFTPSVSGMYKLNCYSVNTGQTMAFLYKDAALGAGPNDWNCIGSTNGEIKFTFGPLQAGKEYLIMDKAKAAPGFPSSYQMGIECLVPAPVNDDCSHALEIATQPFSKNCTPVAITTKGANLGNELSGSQCGIFTGSDDDEVWIKFTATSDLSLFRFSKIQYDDFANKHSKPGFYINIYNGPCTEGNKVDCGYIFPPRGQNYVDVYSYLLRKGSTYYMQIFSANQFSYLNMDMCIMDMTGSTGAANSCTAGNQYSISKFTDNDNTKRFVPFTDQFNLLIGAVKAAGNTLGNVSADLFIHKNTMLRSDANGRVYADRNITFNTENQPSGNITVRILLSKNEIERLQETPGSGVALPSDLRITQNDDACAASFTNTAYRFIKPDDVGIFNDDFYFIDFTTDKLSSFYIHGGNKALSNGSSPLIQLSKTMQALQVVPNPFKDQFDLKIPKGLVGTADIIIKNMQGNIVYHQNINLNQSAVHIQTAGWQSGTYSISVTSASYSHVIKAVKQ